MVSSNIDGTREKIDILEALGIHWAWDQDMKLQFDSNKCKKEAIELLKNFNVLEDGEGE